ncbi:hypothetical protein RRSL_04025 [Ralstonia solanacearum UW551]|uniref:Uncharacterized protein n=1 Tax=Ralstonia solanacearum (strain UW551) TaxID=342110 RepID=A0AB33VIN3_RALSU|nr:hypothetical protein RRSL_04025 [Ralstonia solanacearum UW551]
MTGQIDAAGPSEISKCEGTCSRPRPATLTLLMEFPCSHWPMHSEPAAWRAFFWGAKSYAVRIDPAGIGAVTIRCVANGGPPCKQRASRQGPAIARLHIDAGAAAWPFRGAHRRPGTAR